MCLYYIFKTEFWVHSFQRRKNTKPQEGLGNNEYAITYKATTYLGL